MDNPRADLPVVINAAMTIVTLGFCLFNAALFVCLPLDTIRTSKTVAVVRSSPRDMPPSGPASRLPTHDKADNKSTTGVCAAHHGRRRGPYATSRVSCRPLGTSLENQDKCLLRTCTPTPSAPFRVRQKLTPDVVVLFSVVVSVSALGALNSNVFALAKICVAASQRGYLPRILANLHCASAKEEAGYLGRLLSALPAALRGGVVAFSDWTQRLRWQGSVPM